MRFFFFMIFLFLLSCKTAEIPTPKTGLITENAMVVSARVEASEVGLAILKKGGNAFDAMIATELALVAAFPFAGNIAGGGFMVYRKNNGETGALDYREKAPSAAHRDMYLDTSGNVIPEKSRIGGTAVGVPGTIAGIFETHKKYGTLPIEEIIQPVIDLALKGVVVTKTQEKNLERYREQILEINGKNTLFSKIYKEGDTIKNPAYAATLSRIVKNGRDEFYKGETAHKMVSFLQENGSLITL